MEQETTDHLLAEWCWLRALHLDTEDHQDLSTFRLSTWCACPKSLPPIIDLNIAKPPIAFEEGPPMKRILWYPMQVVVLPVIDLVPPSHEDAPPPPPLSSGDDYSRRAHRRRRRDSLSSGPPTWEASETPSNGNMPRVLVHTRLGTCPVEVDHVERVNTVGAANQLVASLKVK